MVVVRVVAPRVVAAQQPALGRQGRVRVHVLVGVRGLPLLCLVERFELLLVLGYFGFVLRGVLGTRLLELLAVLVERRLELVGVAVVLVPLLGRGHGRREGVGLLAAPEELFWRRRGDGRRRRRRRDGVLRLRAGRRLRAPPLGLAHLLLRFHLGFLYHRLLRHRLRLVVVLLLVLGRLVRQHRRHRRRAPRRLLVLLPPRRRRRHFYLFLLLLIIILLWWRRRRRGLGLGLGLRAAGLLGELLLAQLRPAQLLGRVVGRRRRRRLVLGAVAAEPPALLLFPGRRRRRRRRGGRVVVLGGGGGALRLPALLLLRRLLRGRRDGGVVAAARGQRGLDGVDEVVVVGRVLLPAALLALGLAHSALRLLCVASGCSSSARTAKLSLLRCSATSVPRLRVAERPMCYTVCANAYTRIASSKMLYITPRSCRATKCRFRASVLQATSGFLKP